MAAGQIVTPLERGVDSARRPPCEKDIITYNLLVNLSVPGLP
jgi:hypothetical protein